MKLCEMWLGLGLGAGLGVLGGMLLMNNCRRVRIRVGDIQDAVCDKIEDKRRELVECRALRNIKSTVEDKVEDITDAIKRKKA